jgi:8-oxo-dGTP pyrophosphatase MutT (NUDIX family)
MHRSEAASQFAPRRSYGVILLNSAADAVCLVQRKNSFGFLTCVVDNVLLATGKRDLTATLSTITLSEKRKLLEFSWDELWKDCGGGENTLTKKQECRARFEWLGLRDIVKTLDDKGEQWQNDELADWGFPKGRLLQEGELPLRCAMRELHEETGIDPSQYEVIRNAMVNSSIPLFDRHKGTDGRMYEAGFFVCKARHALQIDAPPKTVVASKEIRACSWTTITDARRKLRPALFALLEQAMQTNRRL